MRGPYHRLARLVAAADRHVPRDVANREAAVQELRRRDLQGEAPLVGAESEIRRLQLDRRRPADLALDRRPQRREPIESGELRGQPDRPPGPGRRGREARLEHLAPLGVAAHHRGPPEARAARVATDVGGALEAIESPLEGGQSAANALGLVRDGGGPGTHGRLDVRALHAGLTSGLSQDDVPRLRVHLPVRPALRVEPRDENAQASGAKLVGLAQEVPAEMPRQRIQAPGAGLHPGVDPGARDVVGRGAPERRSERLRRQSRQLDARRATARAEVHLEGRRHRRQRQSRDLEPLTAELAADAGRAVAWLEGQRHLESARAHVRPDGGRRQDRVQHVERDPPLRPATALRRPGDLAVGELGATRHGSREARDGSGEREVARAPELAHAEPLVLEGQRALDGHDVAEAGAHPSRPAVAR